jgi:hypothetical protein
MEIIENSFSFEDTINELSKLNLLINNISNDKKKKYLKYKIQIELDFAINRIEECYYKNVLKNKSPKNIIDKNDLLIYQSRQTIDRFLPQILLYNVLNNINYDNE